MYKLFISLIHHLRDVNAKIIEVSFKEDGYFNIDFIDAKGNKYTGWFRKEEEIKNA